MFSHRICPSARLEELHLHHAAEFFAAVERDRDHLREWLPWVDGMCREQDAREHVRRAMREREAGAGLTAVLVCDARLAGCVRLYLLPGEEREFVCGYWLAASFQGRGLMTRACAAILGHAFNALEAERVEIRCAKENYRSRGIPDRLGFSFEGTSPKAEWLRDRFVDWAVYCKRVSDDQRALAMINSDVGTDLRSARSFTSRR